jgi:hypothetical protein
MHLVHHDSYYCLPTNLAASSERWRKSYFYTDSSD